MAALFRARPLFRHRSWRSTTALSDDGMDAPDNEPCTICHVPVGTRTPDDEVETWSVLPCGHRFGSYCAKRWLGLADTPACPICRTPMLHACGHPVLPVPVAAASEADSDSTNKTDAFDDPMGHKMACMASDVPVSPGSLESPGSPGSPGSTGSTGSTGYLTSADPAPDGTGRTLTRFRRRRRLSAPCHASTAPRSPPDTLAPCDYCALSLVRHQMNDGPSNVVSRATVLAIRVFAPHTRTGSGSYVYGGPSNQDNAYWERWRKDNSAAFGQWWAAQQPPTEPARVMAPQGWAGY